MTQFSGDGFLKKKTYTSHTSHRFPIISFFHMFCWIPKWGVSSCADSNFLIFHHPLTSSVIVLLLPPPPQGISHKAPQSRRLQRDEWTCLGSECTTEPGVLLVFCRLSACFLLVFCCSGPNSYSSWPRPFFSALCLMSPWNPLKSCVKKVEKTDTKIGFKSLRPLETTNEHDQMFLVEQ